MDVRADAPAADTLEDTEGLGVQGVGMANDTVEDVGDICFKVSLTETEMVSWNIACSRLMRNSYRPLSQAGEPMAVSSMAIVKRPSNGRSS